MDYEGLSKRMMHRLCRHDHYEYEIEPKVFCCIKSWRECSLAPLLDHLRSIHMNSRDAGCASYLLPLSVR